MSGQRSPGPVGGNAQVEDIDVGTSARISTPAPALAQTTGQSQSSSAGSSPADVPMSGGVLYAIGQASVVRIPVPGTNGLCIELNPRGWVPRSGSTSTLFFQDATGKRNLRLDYGYNVKTRTIDYHWNQKGTFAEFGIADHTPVGQTGEVAYNAAKYFRIRRPGAPRRRRSGRRHLHRPGKQAHAACLAGRRRVGRRLGGL